MQHKRRLANRFSYKAVWQQSKRSKTFGPTAGRTNNYGRHHSVVGYSNVFNAGHNGVNCTIKISKSHTLINNDCDILNLNIRIQFNER